MSQSSHATSYLQLGLRTSQINYYCSNQMSAEAGKMVMDVFQEKVWNTINARRATLSWNSAEQIAADVKENVKQYGQYSGSSLANLYQGYQGEDWRTFYNMFSDLNVTSQESFVESFEDALKYYENYCQNDLRIRYNGFTGSSYYFHIKTLT